MVTYSANQIPEVIKLKKEWRVGQQLAQGGFGRVWLAYSEDGSEAVVKLIPKAPGAGREILFGELSCVPNVVPFLDDGEWDGYWAIVMPKAEKSLRDYLGENIEHLTVNDTVQALIDITRALIAIEGQVIHRDIKPDNVLLLNGRWCLADFGISRYAEATTAADTHKFSMTPLYAAPEQWRGEQATSATDVYAMGVVAYELLAGRPPFTGPNYREQHLGETPSPIPSIPPRLQSMIDECLYKSPQARPRPQNLLERLQAILKPTSNAGHKLQQANVIAVQKRAEEERQLSVARSEEERRFTLFVAAEKSLEHIVTLIDDHIMANAPTCKKVGPVPKRGWSLNGSSLGIEPTNVVMPQHNEQFENPFLSPTFEVAAYTSITLLILPNRHGYEGRSHSLWYCDAKEPGNFRWYETAFIIHTNRRKLTYTDPSALPPGEDAYGALSPVTYSFQVAWPFTPIDQGEEDEFIERWLGWFADAAQGNLRRPSRMPERDPSGSWRRE